MANPQTNLTGIIKQFTSDILDLVRQASEKAVADARASLKAPQTPEAIKRAVKAPAKRAPTKQVVEAKGGRKGANQSDLAQRRKALGITQPQMAEKLGVKQPAISHLENSEKPSPALLEKYLKVLQTASRKVA